MTDRTAIHPTIEELAAFVRGSLSDERRIAVERHVENCQACCEAMESVPDDTWIGRMRQAETAFEGRLVNASRDLSRVFDEHPRYRLLRKLGEGGMGEVFLAEHRLMERLVALKVIRSELVSNEAAVARFRREVKSAAKLSHRGIVTAFDAEEFGGLHVLVMEYVDGTSLDEVVARHGRLPIMHACNYARQTAVALQHAHDHGMVHRDVKPHNLMLLKQPSGLVKILDFGLTRIANQTEPKSQADAAETASGLTLAGATVGTPDYMAPEQVQDPRRADIRADVYSLGCTLYFLLTGRPPFPTGTLVEKLSDQMQSEPTPLEQLRVEVPEEVVAIVRRMMHKDPAQRFQTPAEVAAALKAYAKPAKLPTPPQPPRFVVVNPNRGHVAAKSHPSTHRIDWRRLGLRHRRAVVVGSCLALVGILACAAVLTFARRERRLLFVLPPRDVDYQEYRPVRDALEERGVKVRVASSRRDVACTNGTSVRADYLLEEVDPTEFDAIVFTGGAVWEYYGGRHAEQVREIVQAMSDDNKHVAAIAVGQKVLAKSGFFQGQRVAYNSDVEAIAPDSGAIWVRSPVVVSGKLITARDSDCRIRFTRALLEALSR